MVLLKNLIITGQIKNNLPRAKTAKAWKKDDKKHGVHRVKDIQLHGGFIQGIWINDLAIITVTKPFEFDLHTGIASLDSGNSTNGNDFQIISLNI